MPSLPARRLHIVLVLAIVSVVLTVGIHGPVLHGSLVADDYMGLFPRTWSDLAETWVGSWHPWPMDRYYRPLAAFAHAGLFEAFGLHARLLHAAALVPVALLTWLLGVFLLIERNWRVAVVGMGLLVGSPLAVEPLVVPPFFVFQSASALVWVLGLLWWQHDRDRPTPRWWPLVALTTIGVLFKEDTVMLLPTLVGAQALHTRGDQTRAEHWRRLLVWTACTGAAMATLRLTLFPQFEAMETVKHPMFSSISAHVVPHLWGWFHPDLDARLWPSVATLVLGLGALTRWRHHPTERRLIWIGSVAAVCAYLPLATLESTHHSRAHLLVLGSTLVGAGVFDLWSAALGSHRRVVTGLALAAGTLFWTLGPVAGAREYASNFSSCEPLQLLSDQLLPRDAPQISLDVRDWAYHRSDACATGTVTPVSKLPVIRWGVRPASAWVDDHVFALWAVRTPGTTLHLHHPDATPADPVDVQLTTESGTTAVQLTTSTVTSVTVTFSSSVRSTLRDGHVMTLAVSRRPGSTLRSGVHITGWPPVPASPPVVKLPE
jgi:hypothetical protein